MVPKTAPTIYQVAKRAGVSTATVSRVLSQPDVVRPSTRRTLMTAVRAMAYTPNSVASRLRRVRARKLLVDTLNNT